MANQAEQVHNDILERVLARELLPGDRIDESDLRKRLELSGTPVREALIALEASGVIERRPRGGARIMSLDLGGLIKLIEVQAEAEGAVAYRAARRINQSQAQTLVETAKACTEYANAEQKPSNSYFDLNLAFHRALLEAAGNEYLRQAVYFNANRLIGYLSARHDLPGEPIRSARDHQKICDAVLQSDGDLARKLMIEHVTFNDTMALDVMNALRPPIG